MLVVKLDKAAACPHCRGRKVVRKGRKKNGSQNLLCKECGKQFQPHYVYKGCMIENKGFVLWMLCRGSGIRDCEAVTGFSPSAVLALIKTAAAGLGLKPKKQRYHRVQIDEQWSYVGRKKSVAAVCVCGRRGGDHCFYDG